MELKYVRDKYVRFSDLVFAVLDKIILLVLIGAVFTVLSFGMFYMQDRGKTNEEPSYMSSVEIYVSCPPEMSSQITFSELLLSDEVLDGIIEGKGLDMTREEIWNCIFTQTDANNTMKLTVIASTEDDTAAIKTGLLEYGVAQLENTIPDCEVTIVRDPETLAKVHSEIPLTSYNSSYLAMKAIPSNAVILWDTYLAESGDTMHKAKKALAMGIVMAFLAAVVLVVLNIFSRKLRYPEEFEEALGMRVLVTGAKDKSGLGALSTKLGDMDEGKVLIFAAHKGEGTTTVAEALKASYEAKGKNAAVVAPGNEMPKGIAIIDAPSVEESPACYDMVKCADRIVFVTTPGAVTDIQLRIIADEVAAKGGQLEGVVLNKVKVNQYGRKARYLGTYFKES